MKRADTAPSFSIYFVTDAATDS